MRQSLNRWREQVKIFAGNVFSPPYLPSKFIWFFILTNLTLLATALMDYSPNRWNDGFLGNWITLIRFFNETSLTNLILNFVIYITIALFCLIVFNYRWSLVGWLTAEALHFISINYWLNGCSYGRWSSVAGVFCDSYKEGFFWFFVAFLLGMLVVTFIHPGADSVPRKQLKKRFPRISVLLATGWGMLLLFGMVLTIPKPASSGWTLLELEVAPPPLEDAVHAYDTKHNKLILFGGITDYVNDRWVYENETWEWNGMHWKNVSPPQQFSPQPRVGSGMAYDEYRDVMVLYGGNWEDVPLCSTWEWDGERWIGLCPPSCPGARFGHEMFYDPVRKKVVLYGGYDNKTFFNDAWEWDGYTWTKIEIEGYSPTATSYALTYNPDENQALGLLSGFPGGTWTFQDNHWARINSPLEPSNRGGMRIVYDPERKIFVTFGGYSKNFSLNDTWLFDGKNWSIFIDTKLQPPVRYNTIMWYDNVRENVMLFGGTNEGAIFQDTWELIFPEN